MEGVAAQLNSDPKRHLATRAGESSTLLLTSALHFHD